MECSLHSYINSCDNSLARIITKNAEYASTNSETGQGPQNSFKSEINIKILGIELLILNWLV